MIDDDDEDYLITSSLLSETKVRKITLVWARNYQEGITSLLKDAYDAVLVDYDLGLRTGIELIREMAGSKHPAPFILYTGRGSYDVDLEAQQAGATLYLPKGEATPLLLERAIRYAIERKQIEKQLLASQAAAVREQNMLQAVMDSLPVGVVIVDPDGGIVRANEEYNKIWGDPPRNQTHTVDDYAAFRAWWMDSGELVKPHEWASAQAVLSGKTVVGQYLQIERFDGSHACVINSAAPVFDPEGNIVGSSVAIMDITQLVNTEQALHETKESYRRLNVSMMNGYALHEMIYDTQGRPADYRFLEVNPAFEEYVGQKAANILGKTVLEIWPETESYWIETYGQVALTGQSVRFENYHRGLNKHFEVVAFRPRANQFAVIFTEIPTPDAGQDKTP